MDINGDGVVTMEEFVELCSNVSLHESTLRAKHPQLNTSTELAISWSNERSVNPLNIRVWRHYLRCHHWEEVPSFPHGLTLLVAGLLTLTRHQGHGEPHGTWGLTRLVALVLLQDRPGCHPGE